MRAILEFDLPEEGEDFRYAVNGWRYVNVIDDLFNHIRKHIKYDDQLTEEQERIYEGIREKLSELLQEHEITY